ncbi:MAG: hypothetical protein JNL08_19255 [Planctomycetes bacterium]|nr:hypothetical protein [Planctomycetota bacterium]
MKFQLGILLCLLAGCVGQPTIADSPSAPGPIAALGRPAAFALRIGIEHLPPDAGDETAETTAPTVEPQPRPVAAAPAPAAPVERRRAPDAAHRHTWSMSIADLTAIHDPIARETLWFVQDLIEADRERSRREVTAPLLGIYDHDQIDGQLLSSEQAQLDAQEEWLQERGPSLMNRPLRKLLRRLPLVQQVEVEFDSFRSDHVPLTVPYQYRHRDERSLGRVSVRVRVDDLQDPLEVAYVLGGVRVGSSQQYGKLSLDWDLTDTVRFELRARTDYESDDRHVRADLAYRASPTTSWHVAVGDDMDFVSTSSIYSLFETPMDGSPGLVLYAVHLF